MTTCATCGYEDDGSFRFCPECGARVDGQGREQRKVVTVLFCDVVGSTALGESVDAEVLRTQLAGYFERMKAIVERHGGVVEKFIGDAVMAVFGLPVVHEDDAVRALRAATEMQEALPALGIEARIGVCSGEVVTGTEERLATGDAVNVAARLQQAAQPGEIVLGESTLRLARDAIAAEPIEPLTLKGKREPVPAWRLVSVSSAAAKRRFDTRLVGRVAELGTLSEAWERARSARSCELVTIVGTAGVGKSRLVAEFIGAAGEATVVRAGCLSYGEGITYWPVVEVVKQLEPSRSRAELEPLAAETLETLRAHAGLSSPDEIAWAFRKLLEAVAAETSVIAVFDDIQWGEDVFLDLLEHVAFLSTGAPILLVCMARPELLDRRSGWGGVLRLQPLGPEEAEELMEARIGGHALDTAARERILHAAGGNPLFVEEMAAMVQLAGDGEVDVPPTLQALLAARLDQLEAPERSVLERGSIEGELFHHNVVRALTPEEPRLTAQLTALVRKELIRPDRPLFAGADAFRFRHLLMRDAAYEALPKGERAELHERFANWLTEHGTELVELDEVVGYHLESAYRYHLELGRGGAREQTLAIRAAERLRTAGRRAVERQDYSAAHVLLERVAELMPDDWVDGRFEVERAWAAMNSGWTPDQVLAVLARAADRAAAAGDRVVELGLRLDHDSYRTGWIPTEESARELEELIDEAMPVFEAAEDDWGLSMAHTARVLVAEARGSYSEIVSAASRVIDHARRAEDGFMLAWGQAETALAQITGARSAEECLRWLDENPEAERRSLLPYRDRVLAMLGRFDEAHQLQSAAAVRVAERGATRFQMFLEVRRFDVAMLERDFALAETSARQACEMAKEAAELANVLWFSCNHARALLALDRDEEAEQRIERGLEVAQSGERLVEILLRQVQGMLLARRGDLDRADRLVSDAVALAEQTDMLNAHGDALLDLAEVRMLAGRDARAVLEQALALYERKGNVVMAERTRSRLEVAASA